jgi:hypothetical protein
VTRALSRSTFCRWSLELFLHNVDLDDKLSVRSRSDPVAGAMSVGEVNPAERHGVSVLHYDRDFDRIAAITGQPVEWVVPAGSV